MEFEHKPVLLEEVLSFALPSDRLALDYTLGGAGHAAALLAACPQLTLLGSDRDPWALDAAKAHLKSFGDRAQIRKGWFAEAAQKDLEDGLKADFILADLGVSSPQLDQSERGFSFRADGPLDMRMDPETGISAAQWLAEVPQKELTWVFNSYGEEPMAPRLARAVVEARDKAPITSTGQLAKIIEDAYPWKMRPKKIHPATQSFQAIRIFINDELGQLDRFLESATHLLNKGGRLLIISFHSLEDRRVKEAFLKWEKPCQCPPNLPRCICGLLPLGKRITRKPIIAGAGENNPRARSAKLRAFMAQ
ncbi:MAG: 16S rRNA (cytosine(1402)-N(4))-methyltransferase [Candidatus Lambdaproteobacteria bacterium RIFOXYD2_FULL_50_16]|uniref:Ribosomal RNA small subunit methyltransferase H n=1 Tax=Candidatus Lambdaproteobacteria bacterium RIFOXYD2_FULL_50_16 TaxID=1817772 RepID=A0A1F6GFZ9_9PROT|nr:MAG: 16S rRNA (cytosine(1402)-N(4))-methyltransferase [Candidatus Lambdaproteobacteria bacterium RIFOXYD2_FULL_50_16]